MNKDIKTPRTVQDLIKKYNFDKILGLTRNVENASKTIIKLENELNNILTAIVINLSDVLDNQSDVSLWFYEGTPTTLNEPYISWISPSTHDGDIYYNQLNGYVYQFNGTSWIRNEDSDLVSAMALTNVEIDVNDHERKVFFVQPVPPYSSGDWWIKEDGTLFICQLGKLSGNYNDNDFISSSKYTPTIAESLDNRITVLKGTVQEITEDYVKFTDLSTGGNTTIAGENISTGSIESNNYIPNTSGTKINLLNGVIDTKNFKVDSNGNVSVASIITSQGLITNLRFQSKGFETLGYSRHYSNYGVNKHFIDIPIVIPNDFIITSINLTLVHLPTHLQGVTGFDSNNNVSGMAWFWCYARKIKLYHTNSLHIYKEAINFTDSTGKIDETNFSEISDAFGVNGYTPTSVTDANCGVDIITTQDISQSLGVGFNLLRIKCDEDSVFENYVDTGLITDQGSPEVHTGDCNVVVDVTGYINYGRS